MGSTRVRGFLKRHGLQARRDLGQNFLVDEALAERLADLAGVAAGDTVVEVGTGLGILTQALAARAARVVSLEVDAGLVRALRAESTLPRNVELVHADALDFDLRALVASAPGRVRVVANLPYSISAPLLRRLLDLRDELADWSVMIQREVALRLLAAPGTRAYGSFAVLHRLTVHMGRTLDLAAGCFFPVPRVRSTFVRMVPLERPLLARDELAWVEQVVRAAFGQRRKTLTNALRGARLRPPGREGVFGAEELAQACARAEIPPAVRAESLAHEQLLALARALAG